MSAFFSPIEPAGQDISPASHVPLPWQSGEPRADTGAKGSHVAANATWKNPLRMQPPRLRAAFCHVQSTITGLLTHSHNTSPSLAAAGFGRHPVIHTIPAPHQWLPHTEDSALSLIQGDMGPSRCKESPHPPTQKSGKGSLMPLRAKVMTGVLTPLRGKKRKGAFQILLDYYASCLRPYKVVFN